jgi:hypothetical protein
VTGATLLASHPLHAADRTWPETNCSVDLWIELLHALGLDPVLGFGFALEAGLDGRAWTFHKYEPEDLMRLYGIRVREMALWRPLARHLTDELADGHLLTVEVDAIHLPDTEGVSYQLLHTKSSVGVLGFAADERTLDYAHGAGRYRVTGRDTAALLRLDGPPENELAPYVEQVDVTWLHDPEPADVLALARVHLGRRPVANPVEALAARVEADLDWLVEASAADPQLPYEYAFAVVRQCGAGAQLAADYVRALGGLDGGGLDEVAAAFDRVAQTAKSLQFLVLRRAMGRRGDLTPPLTAMAEDWAAAIGALVARYG